MTYVRYMYVVSFNCAPRPQPAWHRAVSLVAVLRVTIRQPLQQEAVALHHPQAP
jgi:hypothetical protein